MVPVPAAIWTGWFGMGRGVRIVTLVPNPHPRAKSLCRSAHIRSSRLRAEFQTFKDPKGKDLKGCLRALCGRSDHCDSHFRSPISVFWLVYGCFMAKTGTRIRFKYLKYQRMGRLFSQELA